MDAPPCLPKAIEERVRKLCLALPEVATRVDESHSASRSTAYVFDIRRRPFCTLVAAKDRYGRAAPLIVIRAQLVIRAQPDEREALLASGAPFFVPRGGFRRLGVMLSDSTDWIEVQQLVTESYRILAPSKLSRLID